MTKMTTKIKQLAEMLKISHTIFALPFALASLFVASNGFPQIKTLGLIILAMFTLRNTGMAFNRLIDADIDAQNPRTASRHIPQKIFSKKFVLVFCIVNLILFEAVVFNINTLCFKLSPFAALIVISYSLMKRFTHFSHLVLGLALGISPIGAWLAVRGELSWPPVILALAVLFWVAGFDMIYATQDYDFDKKRGLHSLVVSLGISKALWLARLFHILTIALLAVFGFTLHLGKIYLITLILITGLFTYEHSLVSAKDLSRVNAAFFNTNGLISLLFFLGVFASVFISA